MLRRGRMKHFLFAQNARKSVTRFILIHANGFFLLFSCSLCTDKNVIISVYFVVQVDFIAILATIIVHKNNIVPRTQAQLLLLIDFHCSLNNEERIPLHCCTEAPRSNHKQREAHRAIDRLSLNTIFGQMS